MSIQNRNEKLAQFVSKEPSQWLKDATWRAENRAWIKQSQAIALRILTRLDELRMNQRTLAHSMGVSPQIINKWVKGRENLTLETISKLEFALTCDLIEIPMSKPIADSVFVNTEVIKYEVFSSIETEIQSETQNTKVIPFSPSVVFTDYPYNKVM